MEITSNNRPDMIPNQILHPTYLDNWTKTMTREKMQSWTINSILARQDFLSIYLWQLWEHVQEKMLKITRVKKEWEKSTMYNNVHWTIKCYSKPWEKYIEERVVSKNWTLNEIFAGVFKNQIVEKLVHYLKTYYLHFFLSNVLFTHTS
jgi:hypothetical protein